MAAIPLPNLSQPVVDTRGWFRRLIDGLIGKPSPAKKEFDRVKHAATTCIQRPVDDAAPARLQPRPRINRAGMILVVAVVLALAGCSLQAQYVEADRLTYEAIAPDYLKLIEASDRPEAEKEMARLTVESWALRLAEAAKDAEK